MCHVGEPSGIESWCISEGVLEPVIGASSGVPDLHGSRIFIQITSSELQG
jgi:hypothetical protein